MIFLFSAFNVFNAAYRVVLLPLPVGPVTNTMPCGRVIKVLKRFKIVGEDEADIKQNKISVRSPIARALIGKQVGDVAVVTTPNGEIEYEIDSVDYA